MPDENEQFGAPMGGTPWGTSGPHAESPKKTTRGRAMGKTPWGKSATGSTTVVQSRYGLRFTIRQSAAIPRS